MKKAVVGLLLSFFVLTGSPAPAYRWLQSQDDETVPIDDTFWTGTVTVETREKAWSEGWNCKGFRESLRTSKITFTLGQVPRYSDVDEWASESSTSFSITGSRSELEVCHPDGNYKGMRQQLSETTHGSGIADVLLSPQSRNDQKPDKMRITLIADQASEKVKIKRHWDKTSADGRKSWDDEQDGSAGRVSFFIPYDPGQAVLSGTTTERRTYKGEPDPSYWSGEVDITYHWNLRRNRLPDLEAIMIPVGKFNSWWPKAGENEDKAGPKPVTVKVRLQKKGAPDKPGPKKAKFKFELVSTSREKGTCLNWPVDAKESFDLKIEQKWNDELSVTKGENNAEEGQQAFTKSGDLNEARVVISCFDYGAYARLKVTAILDEGKETELHIPAHLESDKSRYELTIPEDKNDNKIADDWEEFNDVQDRPANDDSESDPKGDGHGGDGLTLYEEYRGFWENGKHICGEPLKKDIFIFNTIGEAVEPGIELFKAGTGFEVHAKLREAELGTERVINRHRTVMAHSVNQHGLKIIRGTKEFRSEAVWEEGVEKVIGNPHRFKHVEIATSRLEPDADFRKLDKTVAHELLHCCNVEHHGDTDLRTMGILSLPKPGGGFEIRLFDLDLDGVRQGAGTVIRLVKESGVSLVPYSGAESELQAGISIYVAKKQGEHSGDVKCVMRYVAAECYISLSGEYVRFEDDEIIGWSLCLRKTGTSINKFGREPEPRYGDAGKGQCKEAFCVNDKHH